MRLQFKAENLDKLSDTVVFLYEKENLTQREDLGQSRKLIEPLIKSGEFKPRLMNKLPLKTEGGWLLLVGLGPMDKLSSAKLLEAGASAVKMAFDRRLKNLDLVLPPTQMPAELALEMCALGGLLADYRQTEYKSKVDPKAPLAAIRFLTKGLKGGDKILKQAEAAAEAICLTRRLVDRPPNELYPESFAQEAAALGKSLKLKIKIYDEKALAKDKMNLIMAVGQGSTRPPRLVVLKYEGAGPKAKPIVLVGKGVTFDSGGMSLKPSASMTGMKTDMAGAASVLGIISAVAKLKLAINLTAIMPLAENMPDGGGFRVGDVFTSRSGQTVEITNTDAEGRLILADALSLAGEQKASLIIDLATLTGACVVALGDRCAGLFTDDSQLRGKIMDASQAMGEEFWPLPLLDIYEENLKSDTADMISAKLVPKGGAINAALFLRRFVPKNVPWAHLDIAGPARSESSRPGTPTGGSGFAVRTLLRFLSEYK